MGNFNNANWLLSVNATLKVDHILRYQGPLFDCELSVWLLVHN
ncbi:hypothetical protein N480_13830 [Pseudoalteromonas luteoviolacea S2607]|nr:hypothetical protein [Pseudoalteromonas luteoviolacea]KZN38730.1 hypothetical protein N480_13830 [Pseudoalteromonas luteoviolacea S2607]